MVNVKGVQSASGTQVTVSTDWFTVVLQDAEALVPVITALVPAISSLVKNIMDIFNPPAPATPPAA